jgi:cyclic pyranopterin phosphate synthase
LYSCLFSGEGTELRPLLRNGISGEALHDLLVKVWRNRDDRYSESRNDKDRKVSKVEMFRMGG